MKQTLSITRKELSAYFGSPMALIFVGAFLAASLFAFFWVDTFFARGIADVRPLFSRMPILMILLVGALTMRQWSEEQRSGTLEVLLTLPVSRVQLVLGKFLGVMALVALALALTLFLPITVSILGNLDWGPVFGGYLAALLMASAYTAIGLFISSRTDNQIVALILTVLACGVLYLVGAGGVTDFVGGNAADIMRALGSGSRFESIQRGVIDLRDLIYYLSLATIFLALNTVSLDMKRWSAGASSATYRTGVKVTSALLVANLVVINVWLYPLSGLRLDLTAQREYSLSTTTKDLLGNLTEPLEIRAYISENTHPLLSPLVPQVSDMLREYEIAGRGQVQADVVDPASDAEVEAEANQTYGIQATALQVAGRYEASVINAYFDILVRYGDQSVVLNFRDLIEVQSQRDGSAEVRLRNLEYDLTRSIKKVVYGFQSVDSVLAAMSEPVKLTLFVTPDSLPQSLADIPQMIEKVAGDLKSTSGGKLTFESVDPDAADAAMTRQALYDAYKLRPISASLFSSQTYYLDMVLQVGDQWQILYPTGEFTEATIKTAIESALKRATTGFLKVVGLWEPPQTPVQDMYGQTQSALRTWQALGEQLSQDYTVQNVDLSTGAVPSDVDVLLVISPQDFTDRQRYAVDQYLMRGGAVIVVAGNYAISVNQFTGSLELTQVEGGLADMLASYGVQVGNSLVMDSQNEPFPVSVNREVSGMTVQEIQAINYPFFVDVRSDAMDTTSPIVSSLQAVTMNWVSPLTVDETKTQGKTVSTLLRSSAQSWLRSSTDIQPDLDTYPGVGFPVEGETASHPLAVSITGAFESYFKGKAMPEAEASATTAAQAEATPTPAAPSGGTIEGSPETARLVVVGSADFLTDVVFSISSNLSQDRYLNNLQFIQNAVDWSVEDLDLLEIRSRGTLSRVLTPLEDGRQQLWEGLNYAVALLALGTIGVTWSLAKRRERPVELAPRQGEKDEA